MSSRLIKKHTSHQQKIGTGFTRSRYCYYRELNRDVEWIFTDHAIKLSKIRIFCRISNFLLEFELLFDQVRILHLAKSIFTQQIIELLYH